MAKPNTSYDRGETWSHKETLALIEVWGEEAIQHRLMVSNRNMDVFEEIAAAVRLRTDSERTASQCRSRVKRLKSDYTRTIKQASDGEKPLKKFAFFDELDRIFRARQFMTTDQHNAAVPSSQEIPDGLANEKENLSSSESTMQEQPTDSGDTAYPLVVFKVEKNPEIDETGWNEGSPESREPAAGSPDSQQKNESKATKRSIDDLMYESVQRLEEIVTKRAKHDDDLERMQTRQDQKWVQQLNEVLDRQKLQQDEMSSALKQLMAATDSVSGGHKGGANGKSSEQSALLTVTQSMVNVVSKLTESWENLAKQQEKEEFLRREREERRYNLLKEAIEQQRRDEKDMFYKVMDMQMKMFQMFCSSLQSNSSTIAPSVPMAPDLPQASSTGL